MAEYIERDALLDFLQIIPIDLGYREVQEIEDYIKSMPTLADVRPVVRGRWEVVDLVEYDGHGECVRYPKEGLRCTNCKNVFEKKLLWKDNYCPNCGADMRETEE